MTGVGRRRRRRRRVLSRLCDRPRGIVRVGAAARSALRRSGLPLPAARTPDDDRLLGFALLAGAALVPVAPAAAVGFVAVALVVPGRRAVGERRRRARAVEAEVPLLVDLLAVVVHGGATSGQALRAVAGRVEGPLGVGVDRAARRLAEGALLADALDGLVGDAGESVRPLVHALLAAHRDGEPLAPALDRLADQLGDERRRQGEVIARRLSVRLLVPLVACILPAFALLAVAPVAIASLRSLPRHP